MDEYKNTNAPVSSGERVSLIPPPKKCLFTVLSSGVMGLQSELMMAPPIHRQFLGTAKTGMEADMILAARSEEKLLGTRSSVKTSTKTSTPGLRVPEMFARGELVYDTEKDAKVTIVRVHVGQTKKGTPIHYVVDREGDGWKQLATKLRKRR